jgi:hypothetical protein
MDPGRAHDRTTVRKHAARQLAPRRLEMNIARAGRFLMAVLALVFGAAAANAQQSAQPAAFTQQELDQILAPIALYPDSLLSQIMMAATYPREVTDAADWSRQNRDLDGDRAVRAVERYDWDPSVKSLVAFPQILGMMDEKINWTEDLGDAFLDQQAQVMDTIQYLRRQAYAAGNLRSSDQLRVDVRDGGFVIDYVNPEVAYLPYYNPVVVYGTWWWPSHQPVYWAPWPGYYTRAGFHGYVWGPPVRVSRGFFYSAPDWRQRRVNIVNVNNYYYRAPAHRADAPRNSVADAPHVWQHDTAHRRDVPRRDANWRQQPRVEGSARVEPARVAPARMEPASPQRMQAGARAEPAPTPAAPAPRVDAATDNRRDGRERGAPGMQYRGAPGNGPAAGAPTPPEARVAPNAPAAPAQPTVAAPAAPAPAVTRSETPRNADSRGRESRGNDGRGYEQRGERAPRNDPRFDSNRTAERANQQPQPSAVAVPAARPPVAAPTPPVAAAAAVVNQPRVAPAPAPAAPPVAASRPPVEAKPAVAATPRAPEARGDARQGQRERGKPEPDDKNVAAVQGRNEQGAQGPGNSRGNGNRQRE